MNFLCRDQKVSTRLKQGQQGFTLLELVIVLTLIALVSSIFASGISRSGEGRNAQRVAAEIAAGLRATRSLAMSNGVSAAFRLDLENLSFSSDGQSVRNIDAGFGITMLTAQNEILRDAAAIRFFPNGGSTGGRIILQEQGRLRERAVVVIDWVTGRVSVSP